ncbi:bacteriophage CI repressor [Variovorax sp. JS1663]|uniref:bacteriophage CI repressor n=1 Tax=Variovorax sp. JS1663 TaxID=1851577 RepID=UPI00117DB7BB|nr:bacteriophage CI repressor [Variovorax sp. JS1663]
MQRLLEYAIKTTKGEARPITDESSLRQRLNVSSGAFTNWKSRGLSKEGAIAAEAEFGCSVNWLLTGIGDETAKTSPGLASANLASMSGPAITNAMRVVFSALGSLHGLPLSQAQNAIRYALDHPSEWRAAAATVEQLLGQKG